MGHPKIDKAKGRIKEAVGALTNDEELKLEGQLDQLAGSAKEGIDQAVRKVKKSIDQVTRSLRGS